jgi:tetratricopeptide (TPR) repeat protein
MIAVLIALLATVIPVDQSTSSGSRQAAVEIVKKIQRADYEGDRAALRQLLDQLAPISSDLHLGSRVRYWRGFALWRRALNGFNDRVDMAEQDRDLAQAVTEFEEALKLDPKFTDAKAALISCLQNLLFIHRAEPERVNDLVARFVPLQREALAEAPDNPRLLWVRGAREWYNPPERGGGQVIALATYARGLELARAQKGQITDPMEPSWGEPELLMNLAFANLNATKPDVAAAEKYAQGALVLVPYWHYVRDILMPQIRNARGR